MSFSSPANIALTKAFINVNPVDIVLQPATKTNDGMGGHVRTPAAPRVSQRFTLLEPSDSGYREPTASSDGSQLTIDFLMLGMPDAIVDEDDVFTYEAKEYKIASIMVDNGYEKRAMVIKHGW